MVYRLSLSLFICTTGIDRVAPFTEIQLAISQPQNHLGACQKCQFSSPTQTQPMGIQGGPIGLHF